MDLSFFKENGYQVVRQFFPKEALVQLHRYLAEEADKTLEKIRAEIPFSTTAELVDQVGKILNDPKAFDQLRPELKQWLSGHYPLEVRLSTQVLNLFKWEKIKALYQSIFPGYAPKMHLPPVIRFVLPGNAYAAVPPHQDISYNQHMDDFFTVWVPLVPIDQQCGGVELFEGTQAIPEQALASKEATESPHRNFWHQGLMVETAPIHREMGVTDILILNKHIVHQSRANLSDELRISLDFRCFKKNSTKHYLKLDGFERVAPEKTLTF